MTNVIAHRGASAYAPENTIEAFALALEMGACGIELDVHLSADNELMVIHDETVNRTSDGRGRVVDKTCAELKKLNFSNGFVEFPQTKIPTLPEVYELVKRTGATVNVEIKCDAVMYWGIWDRLIALERQMDMCGRILYSSFNHYVLPELRKLDPQAQIGILYSGALVDPWVYAQYMKANAIHPHYLTALLSPGLMEGCKANGIAVNAWTVDDPAAMQKLAEAGVDGIITNKPDVALGVLGLCQASS